MNPLRAGVLGLCVFTGLAAPGCALLSKGDQGAARFFSLGQAATRPVPEPAQVTGQPGDPAELRLGRVTGAPHLGERLVFRTSTDEIGYYRELRWTEPPGLWLKRMLGRVLFEERGLRQIVGGAGPTLDLQLTAFDEIRAEQRLARAQVIATLHDEHRVLWEETITVDCPIIDTKSNDPALATVAALGQAMQGAVDRVVDRVVRALQERK